MRDRRVNKAGKSKAILDNALEYLAGMANIDDIFSHIKHFEKNIPDEIARFEGRPDAEAAIGMEASRACHNYSAWIRLYAEMICNKAMAKLSRYDIFIDGPADYRFEELTTVIPEKVRVVAENKGIGAVRLDTMIRSFRLVIELRHCLQHGGLPRSVRKTAKALEPKDLEEVCWMSIPLRFNKTRQTFLDADELVELMPQKIIVVGMNKAETK
jgi:hypothetical protein